MFINKLLISIIVATALWSSTAKAVEYPIVRNSSAGTLEQWAGKELSTFLSEIYQKEDFPVVDSPPNADSYILLGTLCSLPQLKMYIKKSEVDEPGKFVVKNVKNSSGQTIGVICGNDSRGVLDGVYSLLEQKLGQSFYLCRNASETADSSPFDFKKWDLTAKPQVTERLTFNWFNFISGVSTWNLPDYKKWIRQSARMRNTEVMLHTYGWGPFTQFSHNGLTKTVGYLQNTAYGNHWGVKHTPDVRKLVGGEVFASEGPVFGADVSKIGYNNITMENRVALAKDMMKKAVDYAANCVGIKFNWAFDVDTTYGQPQNIIATLPESARFRVGDNWVARPDTEAGYNYFKKIIETTMNDYPGISTITLWWRGGAGTPFGGLTLNIKPDELPADWKKEFDAALPEFRNKLGPGHLYHAKMARAFRRALNELGHKEIKLGYGSWWREDNHGHFMTANYFLPKELSCYALDYHMLFNSSEKYRNELKKTGSHRRLVVIEWAHHDDGGYLGRPYIPPSEFATKLKQSNASGYGVIHWTTRPLDLFFKSLQNQVWSNTLNEPLEKTCEKMALDYFGEAQGELMSKYLYTWITKAPRFARETGGGLGNKGIKGTRGMVEDCDNRARECEERIKLLEQADLQLFSNNALETWSYFKGHEEWIKLFHLAHKSGSIPQKKETIRKYVEKTAYDGGITRGEMGILIQHNLKWLRSSQKK